MYPEFRQMISLVPKCRKFQWHCFSFYFEGSWGRELLTVDLIWETSQSVGRAPSLHCPWLALTVWGLRPLGKSRESGGKLCCEGWTPTVGLGLLPPLGASPTSLPDHRGSACQRTDPPQRTVVTALQSVWHLLATHSGAVCHGLEPTCSSLREDLWAWSSLCKTLDTVESVDPQWGSCTIPGEKKSLES